MIQKRQTAFEVKEIGDAGEFSGYASVFGVVDSYGDVVVKGAFERTIAEHKAAKTMPKLLLQHNSAEIVGEHTVLKEDDKGLYIEGVIYKDDKSIPEAAKAYSLIKRKQLSGISIGFSIYENGIRKNDTEGDGDYLLTDLNLWENSFVTFAANPDAKVESVKSALLSGDTPKASHVERALREIGFSTSQSKKFMSGGYKMLDEEQGMISELEGIIARIKSN
ncbi:HK97 family phage prohead protease [uncultured Paraglaciecola sp.]|uniref:HK97 family phage prohead protease n=1 Tax=uncultured Paraglaciecola sp. TaxID=1765024 RepID=UPI002624821B|nr:HK97 family phage prohead protease [uncultured Paraglaciecola sp.]